MEYIIEDYDYDVNAETRKLSNNIRDIESLAFELITLSEKLETFRDDYPHLSDEEFQEIKMSVLLDIVEDRGTRLLGICRSLTDRTEKLKRVFQYAETR